jgi:hypothetical protein
MSPNRITRLAAAVPLLFTILFATCPNGRDGHVFTLKVWSIRVTANTCS